MSSFQEGGVDDEGMDNMDMGDGDDFGYSQSAPGSDNQSRNSRCPGSALAACPAQPTLNVLPGGCRLARKAESARQARLRHKQFVTDLQQQVDAAMDRVRELEAFCTTGAGSAANAVRELKGALPPEQMAQLQQWYIAPR